MKSIAGTLAAPFNSLPLVRRGIWLSGYRITPEGYIWSFLSRKFIKPYPIADGYLGVALRHEGRTLRSSVHSLVAEAFLGPKPDGLEVRHYDGLRSHNAAGNLKYGTRAQNIADKVRHGTSQHGERNPSAKLTNDQAQKIIERRSSGELLRVLAAEFGVSESAISRIATGTRRAML